MKKILIALAFAMAVAGCSTLGQQKWEYKTLVLYCVRINVKEGSSENDAREDYLSCARNTYSKMAQPIDEVLLEMGNQSWELVSTVVQDSGYGVEHYAIVFKRPK
jgi:hypothetical protein